MDILKNKKNILYYLQGNFWWYIYRYIPFLLPQYIKEQVIFNIMNAQPHKLSRCLANHYCVKCNCVTEKMLFSSKQCEDKCYIPLMSRKKWKTFKDISYPYQEITYGEKNTDWFRQYKTTEKI